MLILFTIIPHISKASLTREHSQTDPYPQTHTQYIPLGHPKKGFLSVKWQKKRPLGWALIFFFLFYFLWQLFNKRCSYKKKIKIMGKKSLSHLLNPVGQSIGNHFLFNSGLIYCIKAHDLLIPGQWLQQHEQLPGVCTAGGEWRPVQAA